MRLRLTPDAEKLVVTWSKTASAADRLRIAEFVETLADGSWQTRWFQPDGSPSADVIDIRPDQGLLVQMRILLDDDEVTWWADLFWIHRA